MKTGSRQSPKPQQPTLKSSQDELESDLIECGCEQIRPGVWISKGRKVFSDAKCTKFKEFADAKFLLKLLNDDICIHWFCGMSRKGVTMARLNGMYIEIFPRKRLTRSAMARLISSARVTR